jgi:hypothetical protein
MFAQCEGKRHTVSVLQLPIALVEQYRRERPLALGGEKMKAQGRCRLPISCRNIFPM